MKVKNAIITAAGFGTRFLPVVKEVPKEMLPIIDKPILQLVVEECINAEMENIVIVVREGNEIIRNYFKRPAEDVKHLLDSVGKIDRFKSVEEVLNFRGVKVINQRSDLPYGNGSPVLSAKHEIPEGEPVAVLFADDLVLTSGKSGIQQLIDYYESNEVDAVLGAQEVPDHEVSRYGIIKPLNVIDDSTGQIEYIIEKPSLDKAPSRLTQYGRFVLPYKIFEVLEKLETGLDDELWLPDANSQIAQNGKFIYKIVDGKWFTTGDPIRYFEALAEYYLHSPEFSSQTKEILERLRQ